MNIQILFGKRLRELRQIKGYSQEDLAHRAGIDRTYMTSVENGKRNISIQNIYKILKALDIPLTDFFNSSFFDYKGN
ncbi:MAG: helix-turn-helix transcriptional regulator [Bacteroidetes bacterium]|nr:helix-turn-helix transcriptional regulator [Bacteroidota bacterium]